MIRFFLHRPWNYIVPGAEGGIYVKLKNVSSSALPLFKRYFGEVENIRQECDEFLKSKPKVVTCDIFVPFKDLQ